MVAKEKSKFASKLTIDLFAPDMSALHRAGLGGLGVTLMCIQELAERNEIADDELPGGPWEDKQAPWDIDETSITLDFGEPTGARPFFQRLFAFAFQLRDGLLFLPAQHGERISSLPVRAHMQLGAILTFLQHGRVRKLATDPTPYSYEPEGEPGPNIHMEFRECSDYKHQHGWKDLVDFEGRLKRRPVEILGPMNPGAIIRHIHYRNQTKFVETPGQSLCLYFALAGCLTLPVNRGSGVLIVPEVNDLLEFWEYRPHLTPRTSRESRITSAGDAVLQAQLRVRSQYTAQQLGVPACWAIVFQPTAWAPQQKSRVSTMSVGSTDETGLKKFEIAWAELAPRLITWTVEEDDGRDGKTQVTHSFWSQSVIRPLVADNLARGRPWYLGFADLMGKLDPISKKPIRNKVRYEKRGLYNMMQKIPWRDRGESTVVRAVHEAMRRRYGRVASDHRRRPVVMRRRIRQEYHRWRLAFIGAKTPQQLRRSLCDLFSTAGENPVLQEGWEAILPMFDSSRWQQTRDLALLALASYGGKGRDEAPAPAEIDEFPADEPHAEEVA